MVTFQPSFILPHFHLQYQIHTNSRINNLLNVIFNYLIARVAMQIADVKLVAVNSLFISIVNRPNSDRLWILCNQIL